VDDPAWAFGPKNSIPSTKHFFFSFFFGKVLPPDGTHREQSPAGKTQAVGSQSDGALVLFTLVDC